MTRCFLDLETQKGKGIVNTNIVLYRCTKKLVWILMSIVMINNSMKRIYKK